MPRPSAPQCRIFCMPMASQTRYLARINRTRKRLASVNRPLVLDLPEPGSATCCSNSDTIGSQHQVKGVCHFDPTLGRAWPACEERSKSRTTAEKHSGNYRTRLLWRSERALAPRISWHCGYKGRQDAWLPSPSYLSLAITLPGPSKKRQPSMM